MSSNEFDVVVVGAGVAGLCCAGELVLAGARTLLISETKEVGFAIKPHVVDGNTAVMQAPTHMVAWGGGWWPSLARRLNADVHAPNGFNSLGYNLAIEGTGQVHGLTQGAPTGKALNAALAGLASQIDPGMAVAFDKECERVLHAALAIPYTELPKMHRVPMSEWLDEQGANDLLKQVFYMIGAGMIGSTSDFCRREASVYGILGLMRALFCAEATFGWVYPDNRTGLAISLADAIEGNGGTVWKGRKVAQLRTEGDRVTGVVLDDGTEVTAPTIALACGNSRTMELLPTPPPEVAEALNYSEKTLPHHDFHLLSVLDNPVLPADFTSWVGVLNLQGSLLAWLTPIHAVSPWSVQPGKQFVESAFCCPADEVDSAENGGPDKIFSRLESLTESFYPGFLEATSVSERYTPNKPSHLWFEPLCSGPKLPRTVSSVDGLWFVGEGSAPSCGIYMEGSASAGILGAREIVARKAAG